MRIKKIEIEDIKRCYATTDLNIEGESKVVFASEDPNVLCAMYDASNFMDKEVLWKKPGGCMSIVQIPGRENEILAVQEFYLKETPSRAKIVWGKYLENEWQFEDVISIPYIHRFDIFTIEETNYFVGATIASSKEYKDDWSVPGKIYVAEIPDDPTEGFKLEVLKDNLYRNHGYWRHEENGKSYGLFGSDEGITLLTPPERKGGKWVTELILDGEIGEIAVTDIDNDGENEIMTIEPFHGDTIKIYKKINDEYKEIYKYDNEIDFAHTLAGGFIGGKNTFVAGIRRKDSELVMIQEKEGQLVSNIIDENIGPANIKIVNQNNRDLILSANHSDNKAAVYIIE